MVKTFCFATKSLLNATTAHLITLRLGDFLYCLFPQELTALHKQIKGETYSARVLSFCCELIRLH